MNHGQLCISLTDDLLRLGELFNQKRLQLLHNSVVGVLIHEKVEEGLLRLLVTSKQESNADQEGLFENLIVVNLLYVLAEELYTANVHQAVLLGLDDLLVLKPVVAVPI